jgi:hypothetical protein
VTQLVLNTLSLAGLSLASFVIGHTIGARAYDRELLDRLDRLARRRRIYWGD